AALAIEGRLRTGHVGLDRVRHVRDAQPEERGLRPIDVDGDFGPALLTGDADVGHAGRALHDGPRVLREPPRIDEVVAANLERQAPIAAPAEHPVHLEVAARRARTNDGARQSGQAAPQVLRDLVVRARALAAGCEADLDIAAVRAAATARTEAKAAPTAATTSSGPDDDELGL